MGEGSGRWQRYWEMPSELLVSGPFSLQTRMDIRPIVETISDADTVVVAGVDAAPVGETDMDTDDHKLHPLQSTVGLAETVHKGAKNLHTLMMVTRSMQPSHTWWASTPTSATTSPHDRQVQ